MADNMASGQNPSGGGLTDPLNMRTTDTGSMKRMAPEQATQARKTIKLRPLSPKKEPAVAPSDLTAAAPAAPPQPLAASPGDGNVATVAMDRAEIERPSVKLQTAPSPAAEPLPSAAPPPSSSVPGVKQTIKLRPSTSSMGAAAPAAGPSDKTDVKPASAQTIKLTPKTAETPAPQAAHEPPSSDITEEKTVAMAKQTIRLVPKKAETPSVAQPKPSDPTVNMQETATLKPSDPTVKLTPSQAPSAAPAPETKPKIGLKRPAAAEAPKAPAPGEEAAEMAAEMEAVEEGRKDEPSIIFTIAAVLALLMVAYLSLMMFGQYTNHWRGGSMGVPGCQVLNK